MTRLYSKLPPGVWGLCRFWLHKLDRARARREQAMAREEELAAARDRLRREQNERSFEKRWGRMF